jgi:hypothetical protein
MEVTQVDVDPATLGFDITQLSATTRGGGSLTVCFTKGDDVNDEVRTSRPGDPVQYPDHYYLEVPEKIRGELIAQAHRGQVDVPELKRILKGLGC